MVTLFFNPTHVTHVTTHHTVAIRYSASATCEALCHASGHLVIYRECYGYDRAFFTLRRFLLCTPSYFLKAFLGRRGGGGGGRQFNLNFSRRLHADLRNIAPARLSVLIHSTPRKSFTW